MMPCAREQLRTKDIPDLDICLAREGHDFKSCREQDPHGPASAAEVRIPVAAAPGAKAHLSCYCFWHGWKPCPSPVVRPGQSELRQRISPTPDIIQLSRTNADGRSSRSREEFSSVRGYAANRRRSAHRTDRR